MKQAFKEPSVYFTTDGNQWAVIYQGMPICANKATREEAAAAARQCKVTPDAGHHWNGTLGQWIADELTF
jgi:hypothetical protein